MLSWCEIAIVQHILSVFLWYEFVEILQSWTMNKLAAAYIKCIKIGYAKFSSVTGMLLDLGLRTIFSTLLHNAGFRFTTRLNCSVNSLVRNVICI